MPQKLAGFQRKLHQARYARKARNKEFYLVQGQPVVVLTKDGKYPTRELGKIEYTIREESAVRVAVRLKTGDFQTTQPGDIFIQDLHNVDILLENEYEETADRVAEAVASVEKLPLRTEVYEKFKKAVENFNLVPAGRILNGAGDDSENTLFNCYVIDVELSPAAPDKGRDSRHAIFYHMARISEIMAHGGGKLSYR